MLERITNFAVDHPIAFALIGVAIVAGVSYLLALAGDPRPVWIWRDLLGVL